MAQVGEVASLADRSFSGLVNLKGLNPLTLGLESDLVWQSLERQPMKLQKAGTVPFAFSRAGVRRLRLKTMDGTLSRLLTNRPP